MSVMAGERTRNKLFIRVPMKDENQREQIGSRYMFTCVCKQAGAGIEFQFCSLTLSY